MSFYVLIRGALGVGKTTVSQRLARRLGAEYVSIDTILDEHELWESGRLLEFLRANAIAVERARPMLRHGTSVVFDGNFYWKTQIRDLIGRLRFDHVVFTLTAPLEVCIERDGRRAAPQGAEGARDVYRTSTAFRCGIEIDATRPADAIVRDLSSRLARRRPPGRGEADLDAAAGPPVAVSRPRFDHVVLER